MIMPNILNMAYKVNHDLELKSSQLTTANPYCPLHDPLLGASEPFPEYALAVSSALILLHGSSNFSVIVSMKLFL